MKDKIMILFISVILLSGCGFEKLAEWDISELYAQKIEGTSKILYKYDAWGGRDSHVSGFIILDSTQTFKIDLKNTLPFYNLSAIPNRSKIEGIKHECYNSCGEEYHNATPIFSPIKIENSDSEGIGLITKIYQNRGLSERDRGLRGDFIFEKFTEAYLDRSTAELMDEIAVLVKASEHRPFREDSEGHKKFLKDHLKQCLTLRSKYPFLDLDELQTYFSGSHA